MDELDPRQYIKKGRQEWNFQMVRSYRLDVLKNILIVILFGILLVVLWWSFSIITQPKMIPYYIERDTEGNTTFKGMIQPTKFTVTDAQMRNQIMRFINDIRSVSSDPVVLKRNLTDAFYISSRAAQAQLAELIDKSKPFALIPAKKRRDIQFNIIQKVTEQTWRCEWFEEERTNGQLTDRKLKAGNFTYITQTPETEADAEQNPSGIYVSEFYITEARVQQ